MVPVAVRRYGGGQFGAGVIGAPLQQAIGELSRGCLVVAIAALGMKTSFKQLARAGWRPLVLSTVETLWMAALVLGALLS